MRSQITIAITRVVALVVTGATVVTAQERPPAFDADPVLTEYVLRTLDRHPALEEARRRHAARLAGVEQSRALPEPVLGYTQAVRGVETRVGPQFNTLSLSQTLPWFGVRDRREAVAIADAAEAAARVAVRQRDLILEVKETYYELAYVDEALRTTSDERLLLDQYERLANSRYASGQGTQSAVVKLQAEITRLLGRREALRGDRQALAARLNALMDQQATRAIPEIPTVTVDPGLPDREAVLALGLDERPELGVIDAAETRSARGLDLAGTLALPTVTLGASYLNIRRRRDEAGLSNPPSDNGRNAFSVSVNLTLPIRESRYAAAVEQATHELEAVRSLDADARRTLERLVEEQLARLRALADQAALFERALLPQAEEALRAAETAYATGQVTVLDLLDSERVLLDVRLVLARQRSDQLIALARLERAIGTTVPGA